MKLSLDTLGRAVGDARLDFYRFYAPSWSEPAKLDAIRADLERPYRAGSTKPATACVTPLRRAVLARSHRFAHAA